MDLIQEFLIPPWLVPLVSSEPWLYLCEITSNPWIWRGLVLLLFGLYSCWPYSTFKELYIPGPSPRLFLGSIPDCYRKDIHVVDLESYDTFGDIWGLFLGRQPFLMIADTEIIHKLFIEEDGKIFADTRARRSHCPFSESFFQAEEVDQRRFHQLLSPAFGVDQLRQVFPLMVARADELVRHFGKFCRNGESVVVRELFARYVRDALMMSMFGADVDTHGIGKHPYTYYWDLILTGHRRYAVISPSLIFPCLKPLLRTLKFHFYWKEAIGYFTELVRHAEAQRKQAPESKEGAGILHHLLDRAEASADPGRKLPPGCTGMSEGELVAQMLRFLVSAFNAATFTLEFAAYLLARHPSVQHRLQQEAARTAGQKGLTYEGMVGMEYLGLVVKETLRLFPPRVWVQAACTRSTVVCQVKIPRGIRVVVPVWVLHHSREYWDQPCQFNPLRFTSEEEAARDPHCFLPFGIRPLATVGSEVSVMLVKVALAAVVRAYRFARSAQTPMSIEIETLGSTRSKEPISLQVDLP